ncbi:MAG: hypothetical protein EHM58_09370 [Ignavibacteriae bacterium]|nr:MAG: hypothetical protein EHM58_09370 [Ignavibacteriota bacterium]
MKIFIWLSSLTVYLFICFYFVLPECLKVWYPAGTNEFIFCFLLPPGLGIVIYVMYRVKSIPITIVVSLMGLISLLAWFGPKYFFQFFTSPKWIFWDCVHLINVFANLTGTSYETINVLIFCLFGPVIFMFMAYKIFSLKKQLKIYNHE